MVVSAWQRAHSDPELGADGQNMASDILAMPKTGSALWGPFGVQGPPTLQPFVDGHTLLQCCTLHDGRHYTVACRSFGAYHRAVS